MAPKEIKQIMSYNHLLVPKEHRTISQELSMDIWNDISRINSAFPRAQIVVEHLIKDVDSKCYSIDMKLSCRNTKVQKLLDEYYQKHMYLPMFEKDDNFVHLAQK
jgi:hypothetical protein